MESKYNEKAGESYSRLVATEIADEHFRRHDYISGKEILELTPIRQINLFVVKHLFAQWQSEADKLRSPYFDYDSTEVQGAMDNLMNTLSRHIKMGRSHFEPLLRLAVKDTLHLVVDPEGFFRSEISDHQGGWQATDLTTRFKYVRINRFLADGLLNKIRSEGGHALSAGQVEKLLEQTIDENYTQPEPVAEYIEQFNRFAPIREDQLTDQQAAPDIKPEPFREPEADGTIDVEEKGVNKIAEEQKSIYQQYEREMTTINDRLKAGEEEEERPAIHQGARVESLRQSLTINQRFMFKNSLFGGDEQAFDDTLNELDGFSSLREARQYLSGEVARRFNWDKDSEEAEELFMMLQRRYN